MWQDGYVCEAVHWPAANWSERRQIVRRVVDHVLQRHLQWPADGYHYAGHQLETVLSVCFGFCRQYASCFQRDELADVAILQFVFVELELLADS